MLTDEQIDAISNGLNGRQPLISIRERGRLIARAIEALVRADCVPQWQPIETAPKDGSLFLCWVSAARWSSPDGNDSSYEHDVSQVDFCSWRTGPRDLPGHGYFDPCCGQIGDSQGVTHWMPLPAAPGITAPTAKD